MRKGKRKVGYRYADGTYPTRITKIGANVYCFGKKGLLSTSGKKLRIVSVNGNKHGVSKSGELVKGWRAKDGDLYYFCGTYLKGKASGKRQGIRFVAAGKAANTLDAALKIRCMSVLGSITDAKASKQAKLRVIWNYMISQKRWKYAVPYTSYSMLNSNSWAKRFAYQMFATKRGDCYGFAACFAALAYEAGFKDVRIATCRVPGNVDRASDGYTHHGLVLLDGLWYDPEADFEGWLKGVYGYRNYPFGMKSLKTKRFSSYKGTGKPRGISGSFNQKVKFRIVKSGTWYRGTESLRPLVGLYYYKGHLYRFDSKGRMKVSAYKKLQKAIAYGKPWKSLRKLIGAPGKATAMASCAGPGKDVAYWYDRVTVSTFKPANGSTEYVTLVGAR